MIVELAADVFAAPAADRLDLAALVRLCRDGDPHVLKLDPPFDPSAPPAGLDRFGDVRGEIELILEYSPEAAAGRSATCAKVRVQATGPSSFRGPVPTLTVFDATRLLSRPLEILVENRRNDGAFLRKVIPTDRRPDFERYEREGNLRIDSEGGLGEMRRKAERLARSPEEAARVCFLFDRDCRDEDGHDPPRPVPSEAAQALVDLCGSVREPWPLLHHMLERRAIENYLPFDALFGWAGVNRDRLDLAEAFHDLRGNQPACFPMKHGLFGDVPSKEERKQLERVKAPLQDHHLTPLFRSLSGALRERLRHGFGADIAGLFHDQEGVARVERANVSNNERLAILYMITERL